VILTRDQIAAPPGLVVHGTQPHPATAVTAMRKLLASVFELGDVAVIDIGAAEVHPEHWRCTIQTVEVVPRPGAPRLSVIVATYIVRDELCVMWIVLPGDTSRRRDVAESAYRFFAGATPAWLGMRTLDQMLACAPPSGSGDA
jgi:hypothetical protein